MNNHLPGTLAMITIYLIILSWGLGGCVHPKISKQDNVSKNYTLIIYATIQGSKRNWIDTDKITAPNDTVGYKKAMSHYYLNLAIYKTYGTQKAQSFVIKNSDGENLNQKLSPKIRDSLAKLAETEIKKLPLPKL